MTDIVISSGHGLKVRGAAEYLDEVNEARRVVDDVAEKLKKIGVAVEVFHDNVSTTQDENLDRIVDFHNSHTRLLDISIHFNAYQPTPEPMGCEVLYATQDTLADDLCDAISHAATFLDRGAKHRTDLYFLNNTEEAAVLIEVCFVDSMMDAELYLRNFNAICDSIARTVAIFIGEEVNE
jgi:N-acetylmuramoyl-L-alanine amidase